MSDKEKNTILMVDDNDTSIKFMSACLDNAYEVFVAKNGKEGIELAKDILPDLIIMDVSMPIMNGIESGRILKKDKTTSEIPIIYITANTEAQRIVEILRVGAADYISKPISTESFRNRIEIQMKIITMTKEAKQKDILLQEQSKLVSMGEMISNIAHQWRQPLSIISVNASNIQLDIELDSLEIDELEKNTNMILAQTRYLSKTIDMFRIYVEKDNISRSISLQECIDTTLSLLQATLETHNIKIIKNFDYEKPIKSQLVAEELAQVLMNLLNNAKDILILNNITDPFIEVSLKKNNDMIFLTVEDNGGGIPNNLLSKIFEPYFTTKFKGQGIGLSLHASYNIVRELLNGNIYAQNTQNGAKFTIELPCNEES